MIVLFGNLIFDNFTPDEKLLFKTDNEKKCLINEIEVVMDMPIEQIAEGIDLLENEYAAWLIPSDFKGEIAFKNEAEKEFFEQHVK